MDQNPVASDPNQNKQHNLSPLIEENREKIVSLTDFSPKIKVYPAYFKQGIPGALPDCYLREGAAKRLQQAASLLPDDLHLVVLDGWRPYEVQLSIYKETEKNIAAENPDISQEELARRVQRFVAFPSQSIDKPANHLTGGAVDLTIANKDGWLEMGTDFDDFTDKARTDWFAQNSQETDKDKEIIKNRTLLFECMEKAGFKNYYEEWWHYDYGNPRWASDTGKIACYKGVLNL